MDCFPRVFMFTLIVSNVWGNPLFATNKLSLATWGSYYHQDHTGPGTYAFGYDIEDPVTGNIQFKQEERHPNGTVTGNYGYVDADGKPHVVTFISDENGYRAKIEIEGEPTKYFPGVYGHSANQETRKIKQTSKMAQNLLKSENDPSAEVNSRIPIIYISRYPSYYKYVKESSISKIKKI